MGQKINPLGYRIGVTEPHRSTWYARGAKTTALGEERLPSPQVHEKSFPFCCDRKDPDRTQSRQGCVVTLHSGRPGVVIGKRGSEIDAATKAWKRSPEPGQDQHH